MYDKITYGILYIMKKQNTIQRIVLALQKTILSMASLHLGIIVYRSIVTKDFRFTNAFRILDLQIFYPPIENGVINFILSWVFIATIFLFFLYIYKKKVNK